MVLGFFSLMMKSDIVLDIPSFWVNVINTQFMTLPLTGSFKFPLLITYLFLYHNVEHFSGLELNVVDPNKRKQSVVFWIDLIRFDPRDSGLFEFTSLFLSVVYKILNGTLPTAFFHKAQEFLHLSQDMRCGDWYVFEDHAEIRLYGASVKPYILPKFVPMRLFALEFIRQGLNVDQVHFVPMKKGYLFKLPREVGPLIMNTRQAAQEVERLLNDMCLLQVVEWAYDPHQVISKRRMENGYSTFVHESRLETEKMENEGL